MRAAGWTALYFAGVLLPAAVAIAVDPITDLRAPAAEAAAALGFFGFTIILVQFSLVSRLRSVASAIGTDSLIQFHQWVGLGALLLAALHALLLGRGMWSAWNPFSGPPSTQTGAAAFWTVAALVATTVFRRTFRLTYERWRTLHLLLSIAAAGFLLAHVLLAGRYTAATPVRMVLAAYVVGVTVLVVDYRVMRPWHLRLKPWEVVSNREEGGSTRSVRVRPVGHPGFAFEAGQFAWLITGASPFSAQQHPLSISSSAELPPDRSIEFSIKALGDWSSTTVAALAPGTRVWVDGPFGNFTVHRDATRSVLLVAGGIGIAPFRSMLLTMRDRGDARAIRLVYAANNPSRVLFADELAALARYLPLEIVYVFEDPPPEWQGERGFVTAPILQRTLANRIDEYDCYVCGPPAMLKSVEQSLRQVSVRGSRIHTERFHVV